MADTKEKERKAGGASPRKGKDKDGKPRDTAAAPAAESAPAEPAPRPRLLDHYLDRVRAKLLQQFGFANPHEIPRLVKIVLNVGIGDAGKNPKGLEAAVAELAAITGQQPVVTRAKKSIAEMTCGAWRKVLSD